MVCIKKKKRKYINVGSFWKFPFLLALEMVTRCYGPVLKENKISKSFR